jgi:hypothetical protein
MPTRVVYQYSKLSDVGIRLLALLPGRSHDPLRALILDAELPHEQSRIPAYEALSYACGDQSNPQPLYTVQPGDIADITIDVGQNLYSALKRLRLQRSQRIIWCDCVCINQVDLEERAQQIIRMADIFSKAQGVVVWLGAEAENSAIAMTAIEHTGSQIQIEPKRRTWKPKRNADPRFAWEAQEIPYSQLELKAIQNLFGRSWFKRLWVRQEVTLAKSTVVVAGNREVTWADLVSTAAFLDEFIRLRGNRGSEFGRDTFNLVEFGYMKSYEDVMDVLHACRDCKCTEDRDRVYAILGMLSPQRALNIQPDWSKTTKEVYKDLVIQYHYHHQRLNILTLCESAETPSWVPDLQRLRLDTGLNTRVAQYCWATGEAAAPLVLTEHNMIQIYGVRCGTLGKEIAPRTDGKFGGGVIKHAIVQILRNHMGEDVSSWEQDRLEILTKGLLGCLWSERTGRKNHARLTFAFEELRKWAREELSDDSRGESDAHESFLLWNQIGRVLFHGDSCRWTEDGHLGLGYSACEEGDHLFAILGCRRLMALRKEPGREVYKIVGKFDHPRYNDGEAILGELPDGWTANYRHLLLAANRPRFLHEHGISQWQDPRVQDISLPDGYHEEKDQDGYPYWFASGMNRQCSYSDPRLTYSELEKRNINVERLFII